MTLRKKLHLIPGTMCNDKLWTELRPYLHSSLELVHVDIPRGKNFDELAKYYYDLFSSDKVNLIGFSLGGYIASYFSMLYPERIEKLFVISNSPTCLPSEELKQRNDILDFVKKYGYKTISRKRIANMLDRNNQTNRLIDLILEMDSDLGENEFISQYQYTSARTDLSQTISRLPLHSHFYYSDDDRLVNSDWFNKLTSLNPKLSVINTSGSGHMLPLEKPQELADYINSWAGL
ncbi:alpha/beta fold hydrolase [Colwelliaceae bacterium BS250]